MPLPSERNTAAIERRIRSVARRVFRRRTFHTFFEHGQWWIRFWDSDGDRTYSVVDAEPGLAGSGFDFEEV